MRSVRSLGLSLMGLMRDPGLFSLDYLPQLDEEDAPPPSIAVGLQGLTLFYVPIQEDLEATAQLVSSGIQLFAEYLLPANAFVMLISPDKEEREVETYMQIHKRVKKLLDFFQTEGEGYKNQLVKF